MKLGIHIANLLYLISKNTSNKFHIIIYFDSKTNLANICLHVENVKMPMKHSTVFPEYNCLILSPANLWQQNAQNFKKDTNLLSTIFHQHVKCS